MHGGDHRESEGEAVTTMASGPSSLTRCALLGHNSPRFLGNAAAPNVLSKERIPNVCRQHTQPFSEKLPTH